MNTTAAQPPRLWVPQEVADYLGVPLKTLYRWRMESKGPPAMKIGKHLRFDPLSVADWAHAQGAGGDAA